MAMKDNNRKFTTPTPTLNTTKVDSTITLDQIYHDADKHDKIITFRNKMERTISLLYRTLASNNNGDVLGLGCHHYLGIYAYLLSKGKYEYVPQSKEESIKQIVENIEGLPVPPSGFSDNKLISDVHYDNVGVVLRTMLPMESETQYLFALQAFSSYMKTNIFSRIYEETYIPSRCTRGDGQTSTCITCGRKFYH